jgi:hypothetical protein
LDGELRTTTVKTLTSYQTYHTATDQDGSFGKMTQALIMDVRFGTWNVRNPCRVGSLTTVARELQKYNLHLVGVQQVRWEKGGTKRAENYTFFYGQGNGDHQLGTGFVLHKRIVSAVRRVEFISDIMSCIILKCRWCNIIVLNVHDTCEDKGDDVKDRFYEELGHVFDQFPRYNMKRLFRDFNANVGRRNVFKPTIGNESLHEIIDNGVRAVKFATSENLIVKSTKFPHHKIHNRPGPP